MLPNAKNGKKVGSNAFKNSQKTLIWNPCGMVELGEFPKEAVIRETKEETGLDVIPIKAIHEDSDYDAAKDMIFVRLVYLCELKSDIKDIVLQKEEHTEYRIIKSIKDLEGEKLIPYLIEILNDIE